jgi:hypothetical protein
MVFSRGNEEWVAFAEYDDTGEAGFEAVIRSSEPIRVAPNRLGSTRKPKSDASATSSWMKKPINTDSSWAPVVPPETREPSSARKQRHHETLSLHFTTGRT